MNIHNEEQEVASEPRFVIKPQDINDDISWAQINEDVLRSLERPRALYWVIFFGSLALFCFAVFCEIYQYNSGLGVADLQNPQVWGLYIATFIFWIGMSHSGTLLSAILHIMHADWRKPIYRFAEAMTTFSLMTAGLFVAGASGQGVAVLLCGGLSERALDMAELPVRRWSGMPWRSALT